jgi:hypothetical protein
VFGLLVFDPAVHAGVAAASDRTVIRVEQVPQISARRLAVPIIRERVVSIAPYSTQQTTAERMPQSITTTVAKFAQVEMPKLKAYL